MKCKLILLLLLAFTAFSRFFLIDKIPPFINSAVISLRLLSASVTIVSAAIIFILVGKYFRNTKIALLSAWVFSILPWVIEQSRINSGPNVALVLILFIVYLMQKNTSKLKYALLLFIPLAVFLSFPQFWIFRTTEFRFNFYSFTTSLLILFSTDFIFFHNITFWWGGVREFGVMHLSLLPFFSLGIYELIIRRRLRIISILLIVAVISALSPFFPESREFYLSVPLFSVITALGIYYFSLQAKVIFRVILVCFLLFVLYDISQYLHYYFIHYPQQIMSNFSKINETF